MRRLFAIVMVLLLGQWIEAQEVANHAVSIRPVTTLLDVVSDLQVHGQVQVQMLPWQANVAARATAVDFANLVPTKIDEGNDRRHVIMMLEAFRMEKRNVNYVIGRDEKRTRRVTRPDGEIEEQEYTVKVPVQMTEERDVQVSAGLKPKIMSLYDFRFFDLDSQVVSYEDAAKILSTLRPVFLVEQFASEPPAIGKYEKEVLRPDVLIVVTKKAVREVAQNRLPGPNDFIVPRRD